MGLFSNNKKLCPICGSPTPRLLATKVEDMPLCKECAGKVDLPDGVLETRDFETAQLMGIRINSVISVTFIIGSLLAAIGSLLYFTNYQSIVPLSGSLPGLRAFVAAVFGGIGSIPGAVVGAFLIGICESVIKGSDWSVFSDAFTFAILIVVLCVKPTGLFGEKVTDKV